MLYSTRNAFLWIENFGKPSHFRLFFAKILTLGQTTVMPQALKTRLLADIERIACALTLPAVAHCEVPELHERTPLPEKFKKFGVLLLEDRSCGFFYSQLSHNRQQPQHTASVAQRAVGLPVADVARWYVSSDAVERTLGMAAINAISQHVFARAGLFSQSPRAINKRPAEHIVMVGYFPPLVSRFQQRGQKFTVLESDPAYLSDEIPGDVTLDPSVVSQGDEVLCTASTLLNDTLPDLLARVSPAAHVALIGPTAGCVPDSLMQAGIHEIGASRVVDVDALIHRLRQAEPWGDSVAKYTLHAHSYPGLEALLAS